MKRILITAGAALLAMLPAAMGFIGNTSFSESLPVRVPSQAVVVDDHGGQRNHVQAGDDKGGLRKHSEAGDDKGGQRQHAGAGDDKGGLRGGDDGPKRS
jgi:hypothetical protein